MHYKANSKITCRNLHVSAHDGRPTVNVCTAGATATLLFAVTESKLGQPRNLIGEQHVRPPLLAFLYDIAAGAAPRSMGNQQLERSGWRQRVARAACL